MNYTDRQGTDTTAQRNRKKGKKKKQKMGIYAPLDRTLLL